MFTGGFIRWAERAAGVVLALVTALTFVSVVLRYVFSRSIPDSYDFGRYLLGILIFWGIAVTGFRGEHITVDLLWGAAPPRARRAMDLFATLITLGAMAAFCWATALKVLDARAAGETSYDTATPIWPFYVVAWLGTVAAAILMALRLARELRGVPAESPPLSGSH